MAIRVVIAVGLVAIATLRAGFIAPVCPQVLIGKIPYLLLNELINKKGVSMNGFTRKVFQWGQEA